jgi:hypothetical protein
MHRGYLLSVTALGEGGTGLLLLVWPPVPIVLLLGVEYPSPEAWSIARIKGAALLALAVACWLERKGAARPAPQGLLLGVLVYDVTVASVLAWTGWSSNLVGVAPWPAVLLHAALAAWCVVSFLKPS